MGPDVGVVSRGRLRVYVAVAPGAGATCALLAEAERRARRGSRVHLGPIDTQGRAVTAERLRSLHAVLAADGSDGGGGTAPDRQAPDRQAPDHQALDLGALLAERPDVVVIDDLAVPNPAGAATAARWQDASALLDAGIDVVGTVRVDEIESLSDLAVRVTGRRHPTVPDALLKAADQLELVDITPEALRRRLAHGNLTAPGGAGTLDPAEAAVFQPARLARLRELALEWMADRAEDDAERYRRHPAVAGAPDEDRPTVAVALTGRSANAAVVRRAARLADRLGARLVGLARTGGRGADDRSAAEAELRLLADLGGEARPVVGDASDVALVEAARAVQAGQLVVGSDARLDGLVARAAAVSLDVHVVPVPTGGPARRWAWMPPVGLVVALGALALAARAVHVPDPWAVGLVLVSTLVAAGAVAWAVRVRADARRVRAEADSLATAARALVGSPDPLGAVLDHVRTTLGMAGMAGVAVVAPSAAGPVVEASAGAPVPAGGGAAAADVDRTGRVLAVTGRPLGTDELRLLRGYAAQVAAARQHRDLHEGANRAALIAEADALRTAILRAVSHDLHTPLASIKASVSGLLQGDVAFSPADRRELLTTIETEADRLHRMVTNLLDVSRLQAGALQVEVRPTYLEDVVAAALANLAHRPERIEVGVPETVPPVLVDPALLERALANLVANALAWSPADRPVRIDAGLVTGDVGAGHAGPAVVHLRVVDRGPGIPPAERARVLEPFQRIGQRSLQAGAGLGLTVVSGFVRAVGGALTLDDTPGGGLTATIALAIAPDTVEETP